MQRLSLRDLALPLMFSVVLNVLTSAPAEPLQIVLARTYAEVDGRTLELDLYRPAERGEPLPAVICLHGGAWRQGSRANMAGVAKALAARGYVAAAVSYRLSGEAKFPAQIEDCKAAVRWLRAHAAEFGIDPARIGATGHSAGGHLAALMATSGGVAELEGHSGNPEQSSRVQAAVAMGAQSDLETERIRRISRSPEENYYPQFLGGTLDEKPDTYRLASPLAHLDPSDPPLAFVTGALDDQSTQADEIRHRMKEASMPTALLVIEQAPHNFLADPKTAKRGIEFAIEFFDSQLKATKP